MVQLKFINFIKILFRQYKSLYYFKNWGINNSEYLIIPLQKKLYEKYTLKIPKVCFIYTSDP